ncbi:Transcriptional regulator, LysR-family [Cupriavidus necator]|uniref:LysR family transcriptional regulator n=1 Tax=Cupriavidus necator (strain ATCC 17699 / DSM 428 / KCTC 22496 / NCIMB 10442 / H16 / Stanier 337) TaxID=381666 RepID=Q0KBJ5_CUPNH|nr:LysR family transcriptional regulator [Cupriavidus necator]QCC00505.1 LysR family transcriptional regulator [Cupriavidus necator H16]QQB76677.1 LysR family transcriptional regulator [Cupriavidus necator]WKA42367.1 LysR family transcriptional regulator [Cupriavidus necator]CAJ92626.1 transcriptional regulator, LysR-family [Cupriavidus necator H16]
MRRKIPSTIALAVFEAAARQGSFARAASEVCLTESAVSRQIATLETYLGVKLFTRVRKQVVLNDAGRLYLKNIARNLAEIEAHTSALMAHKGVGGVLELAVIPTFANRWLLPRLRDFRERHPDIILNLSERPLPFSFDETNFDAALNFEHPAWTNVVRVDLFDEELVPIVSPRYFDTQLLGAPADLAELPLLHKSTRPEAWRHWFAMAAVADFTPVSSMHFELYGMVIEAARAGLGAGLVPRMYVQDEIERNDLVVPFDLSLKHEKRYCLVYPERKKDSALVQLFRDWVVGIEAEWKSRLK